MVFSVDLKVKAIFQYAKLGSCPKIVCEVNTESYLLKRTMYLFFRVKNEN